MCVYLRIRSLIREVEIPRNKLIADFLRAVEHNVHKGNNYSWLLEKLQVGIYKEEDLIVKFGVNL